MNVRKHQIWQILDTRNMAGIESHVAELAQGLMSSNWSVTVVFLNDFGPHPLKTILDQSGIEWFCLNGTVTALWKAISEYKPALIHTHGYKAGILARCIGKIRDIKIVSTYHAGEKCEGKLYWYNRIDQMTSRLAKSIAVSSQINRKLSHTAVQIDNFVSIPPYFNPKDRKRIAFVGRLSHEKGPDIFCEIAKNLTHMDFDIFGEGPLGLELQAKAPKNVTFHGQQKMADHWQNIDLLCMPSRFEGLPMAALEAMAQSIPVVASKVGGLPQLINHQKSGWICSPENIDQFTSSICDWHALDTEAHYNISKAAFNTIKERYSPQAIIPKIETIYNSCWTQS